MNVEKSGALLTKFRIKLNNRFLQRAQTLPDKNQILFRFIPHYHFFPYLCPVKQKFPIQGIFVFITP